MIKKGNSVPFFTCPETLVRENGEIGCPVTAIFPLNTKKRRKTDEEDF